MGFRNLRDQVDAELWRENSQGPTLVNSPDMDDLVAGEVDFAQLEAVQPRRNRRFTLWRRVLQSSSAATQIRRAPRRLFSRL